MNKYAVIDGKKFISMDMLVEEMVRTTVLFTSVDDIIVSECEKNQVAAYRDLLQNICEMTDGAVDARKVYKDRYVAERFIRRTLGG